MVHPLIDALVNAHNKVETMKAEDENPEPNVENVVEELTPTKKAVIEMLVENTGVHMLDSGGAYGRAWQRNRTVTNWDEIPDISIDIDDEERCQFSVIRSTYHFLVNNLLYDEECERLEKWFKAWAMDGKMNKETWIHCMEKFPEELGAGDIKSYNTYDGENVLNQVLQFVCFSWDDNEWVLLQVHGGCDVRGGYSIPKVFKELDGFFNIGNDLIASCTDGCWRFWSDDGGYNWYKETFDEKKVLMVIDKWAARGLVQETLDGKKINPLNDIDSLDKCMKLDGEKHMARCKFCGNPVNFW